MRISRYIGLSRKLFRRTNTSRYTPTPDENERDSSIRRTRFSRFESTIGSLLLEYSVNFTVVLLIVMFENFIVECSNSRRGTRGHLVSLLNNSKVETIIATSINSSVDITEEFKWKLRIFQVVISVFLNILSLWNTLWYHLERTRTRSRNLFVSGIRRNLRADSKRANETNESSPLPQIPLFFVHQRQVEF